MKHYLWDKNAFYQDMRKRILGSRENVHTDHLSYNEDGVYHQPFTKEGCSAPGFLQNQAMAWDVNERGIAVLPMLLGLRTYFSVSAVILANGKRHDLRALNKGGHAEIFYHPGCIQLQYRFEDTSAYIQITLPPDAQYGQITFTVQSGDPDVQVEPYLLLYAASPLMQGNRALIMHFPIKDPVVARNNSVTADPPRVEDNVSCGFEFQCTPQGETIMSLTPCSQVEEVLLCDRKLDPEGLHLLALGSFSGKEPAVLKISEYCKDAPLEADMACRSDIGWKEVCGRLVFSCGVPQLNRQFPYSVHNSLFSRAPAGGGRTMFIHGRPDHGYGDCAKLHQSYQMHYPALLAGEYASVKSELMAFAELMDEDGGLEFQLKVGGGRHHYTGLYSNAHFLLAVYRYLCLSGDMHFLEECVLGPNGTKTMLEALFLAADWLLVKRIPEGVMPPCGWLDAWPPNVSAQAQVSIAAYHGLHQFAKLLHFLKHPRADVFRDAVTELGDSIQKAFYRPESGLFAEHLFVDGRVSGGEAEDFWVHTQIWAALSGLAADTRGLALCALRCMKNGLTVIPEEGMFSDYVAASTDGLTDLDSGSTATWLLAAWPELSHLFAICCAKMGDPEMAYRALIAQLPQRIHHDTNQAVSPFYYPEKFLYPYDLPWLCTWAGDPTLIQLLLEGFMGIHFTLSDYAITPSLPKALLGKPLSATFVYRGRRVTVRIAEDGKIQSVEEE